MAWKIDEIDMRKGYELRSKLSEITNELKLNEKISVIFLLCVKPSAGLRVIEMLLKESNRKLQNNVFYKWLREQSIFKNEDWSEKVVELLAIIQNYRIAKSLGYHKEDLKCKFMPKNNLKSYHVCNLRKVLYNLCEMLTASETLQLIEEVEAKSDLNKVKVNYQLEYKLLQWSENDIISLEEDKGIELDGLVKCLKSLNCHNLVHDIEFVSEKITNQLLRRQVSTPDDVSIPEHYPVIDKKNIGFCVIINEKNFTNKTLTTRWGTAVDVERLVEIFTVFGFDIKIHTDLTKEQLVKTLIYYSKLIHKNHSFFVLVILSHGSENEIYTSDSVSIDMDTIEMLFQAEGCPNLIGKPKIFILQSCQGSEWQKLLVKDEEQTLAVDAPAPSPSKITKPPTKGPQKGDSMIAWSTVQGFASFRDKYNGSWYILELCKELWRLGDVTDLVEILTKVNNNLRSKVYGGQFMVPSLLLSLRAKVKFPVSNENLTNGKQMMLERLIFNRYFREFCKSSMESFTGLAEEFGK